LTGNVGQQGPQGNVGPTGPQGIQGIIGPVGPIGPIGPQGNVGPTGPQGIQGIIGPVGPIGPQGNVGPVGPAGTAITNTGYIYSYIQQDVAIPNSSDVIFDLPSGTLFPTILGSTIISGNWSAGYNTPGTYFTCNTTGVYLFNLTVNLANPNEPPAGVFIEKNTIGSPSTYIIIPGSGTVSSISNIGNSSIIIPGNSRNINTCCSTSLATINTGEKIRVKGYSTVSGSGTQVNIVYTPNLNSSLALAVVRIA
jgi:hypothetical protein